MLLECHTLLEMGHRQAALPALVKEREMDRYCQLLLPRHHRPRALRAALRVWLGSSHHVRFAV